MLSNPQVFKEKNVYFLQLLTIFVSGKLEQYENFYARHKDFVTSIGKIRHN